jgi:hypothetical protein
MADLGDTSYQDAKALRWAYNMMYLRRFVLVVGGLGAFGFLALKIVGVL